MNALMLTDNQQLEDLTEEEKAKVCLRTILAGTTSENIEQNVEFLYSLITGGGDEVFGGTV